MGLDFMEGWDMYGPTFGLVPGNVSEFLGTPVLQLTGGKLNGQHVSLNQTSDIIRIDIPNVFNSGDHFLGFHFKIDSLVQNKIIQWTDENDANGLHSHLEILSNGALRFDDDDNIDFEDADTVAGVITPGVWHTIECRMKPSTAFASSANADGQFELRVDGTVRLNLVNIAIGPADLGSPRPVGIGKVEFRGGAGVHRFDDIYIFRSPVGSLNNNFAGNFFIETIKPNADTPTVDWTPVNAGDNFAEVDDADPDNDASYNSSQTQNDTDLYEHSDLTGNIGTILGYGPMVLARREIGSTQNINIQLQGSSQTVNFPAKNLSTNYEYRSDVRSGSVDDLTNSTPPDIAEVNAIKGGMRIP